MIEVALGVIGSALAVTNGVIIWICGDLKKEFSQFSSDCRTRHENVMTKGEFWHEHTPLEEEVRELRRVIDRCEACKEVSDRR